MSNYGSFVSRTLPVSGTAFITTLHGKGKPSVDADHNLDSDLADYNSAQRLNTLIYSGVTNVHASNLDAVFIPTLDPYFVTTWGKQPNEFAIQNFDAVVNGWVIPVYGSRVNGGNYDDLDYLSIEMTSSPAPSPMFRQDLVFLEVWRAVVAGNPSTTNKPDASHIYRYGNVQFGGANILDDIKEPTINANVAQRIQVQYRIRIAEGVDFDAYPNGVDDININAQGGAAVPNNAYAYTRSASDPGLYIAGDGSGSAQTGLGNVDGYVYAIPICKVHRRNSAAYSLTNPNGTNKDINDPWSDRPDGLFYDEISLRDIADLRHQVVVNKSYSEMLEENFEALLRRDLIQDFGKDTAIDSQIQGKSMLTVDGFSVVDQSGVYDMPFDPDSLRRDYSGEDRVHDVMFHLDLENTPSIYTSPPVMFNTMTSLIQISLSGAGAIQGTPEVYVDGVLIPTGTAIPGGWTGSLPGPALSGVLAGGYTTQKVSIKFSVKYQAAGHRFVATNYYKIYNGRASNPEEWAFTINPTTFTSTRSVFVPGLPIVSGVPDNVTDYPVVTMDSNSMITYPVAASGSNLSNTAITELYEYHMLGNGTTTYILPGQANTRDIIGVYQIYESDVSPIAFNVVNPTSVTRNINGTFTVVMPSALPATKIIKFKLSLEKTSAVLDQSTKGIKEIMRLEAGITEGTGVSTYSIQFKNFPYGFNTYKMADNTLKFFAYVAGLRVDLDNADVQKAMNKVTITFNAPVTSGDEIRFYALCGYSPVALDRIQMSYDRIPYQGLSDSNLLIDAQVLAVGRKPLVHSVGTAKDTAYRNAEMYAISELLPLGFGLLDTDIKLDDLTVDNSQFTNFKMLRLPWEVTHDYRTNSTGKLIEAGDTIFLSTVSVVPERGIKDKVINIKNNKGLTSYPGEFVTPKLSATKSHQVVTYYLIKTKLTSELFLLVVSYTATNSGNTLVKTSVSTVGVSYDVYKIKGNPILK